ncbi:protein kinase [Candidatus Uabimicrobium sp. HlEnr_7]|uniref:protein kinase domain-containing protein n=1 Tax=Candidatus Uabimicrobium helgolandensis TaxID=3095367 RepID=UPI00355748BD
MQAYLSVKKDSGNVKFSLDAKTKTSMGRLNDCTIQLQDSKISSHHCCIEVFGNYFYIIDLNSTNGTYVNNTRVRSRQLYNGDEIQVGDVKLFFEYEIEEDSEQDITWAEMEAIHEEPKKEEHTDKDIIGNYRIIEKIGQGGIGEVYKAAPLHKPHEIVAIKILNQKSNLRETLVERFLREARALIALDHPRIIKVFELGEHKGRHYFSMECIEGHALNKWVSKNGKVHYKNALKIAGHIAHGLAYAHKNNIIHRDLKPANVIVEEGTHQVKLIDLGLAKMLEETDLTMERNVIGTPRYMAPEQIRDSKGVDVRADVYSLGATLYHMLTGIPPYAEVATTKKSVLLKHIYKNPPVPITSIVTDIPPVVIKVVRKAMAKNKENRFRSAQHMYKAIYQVLSRLKKE